MMKNNILYTAPAAQDTVAAVMSREPLVLSPRMTAREALARLRQVGIPQDFLTNCYVVDEEGLLLGLLTVRTLLTLPERARLDQAAGAPKAVLAPQEDQERAAALLDQLEVSELPVAPMGRGVWWAPSPPRTPWAFSKRRPPRIWSAWPPSSPWSVPISSPGSWTCTGTGWCGSCC